MSLEDIKARAEAATVGPWKLDHVASDDDGWLYAYLNHDLKFRDGTVWQDQALGVVESGEADAEFIAHARTDIPKLVAALEAVQAKVKELQDDISGEPQEIGNALEHIITDALGE